jgi:hypothetical protein
MGFPRCPLVILLVGGFKHLLFSIIYGIILPIDEYFSEGLKPPTRLGFPKMEVLPDHPF